MCVTTVFVYEHLSAIGTPDSSLYCEGRAMLDAVTADLRAVPGVTVHTLHSESADALSRLAANSDWSLIIAPETDGILEDRCRRVLQAGGRLLGPTPEAVRLTADKWELHRHFTHHGIATPETRSAADEAFPYPFVLKPRDGAGSQNTHLVTSRVPPNGANLIAQRHVKGNPVSVAVLCGPGGNIALQPCSQRLSQDGRFKYEGGETPITPTLSGRARELVLRAVNSVPGLLGYVGVDLVLGDEDVVIEINPRLTTSYIGLRRAALFNVAEAMLSVATGQGLPELRWRDEHIAFTVK